MLPRLVPSGRLGSTDEVPSERGILLRSSGEVPSRRGMLPRLVPSERLSSSGEVPSGRGMLQKLVLSGSGLAAEAGPKWERHAAEATWQEMIGQLRMPINSGSGELSGAVVAKSFRELSP
ncbi:Uncharacterized protein Adt_41931 [Abeliophyllum distichum]|uniref:Uncharacterized protein n=1 Tax=Abeliophyllum distichum TaxID=126358 RepID=A0ABD1PQ88_9LAMI